MSRFKQAACNRNDAAEIICSEPNMLYRLTIKNRTASELLELAEARRRLAARMQEPTRSLLLNEAKLLEYHAEMKGWLDRRPMMPLGPNVLPAGGSLLARFAQRTALADWDQRALLSIARPILEVSKDTPILEQGRRASALFVISSGWFATERLLADGTRRVLGIYLPGEVINPGEARLGFARTTARALTSASVLPIDLSKFSELSGSSPGVVDAFWRETAMHATIQSEWLINFGRPAQTRFAHLICELAYRSGSRSSPDGFDFPLTQHELGDVLALSTVHVNRTLQALRAEGLIRLRQSRLTILKPQALEALAEFDVKYIASG